MEPKKEYPVPRNGVTASGELPHGGWESKFRCCAKAANALKH